MFRCHRDANTRRTRRWRGVTLTAAARSACVCTSPADSVRSLSEFCKELPGMTFWKADSTQTVKEWTGIIDGKGICATQACGG